MLTIHCFWIMFTFAFRMLGPCFLVVSAYTILSCCVCSWVRSRPLLAVGGVISAAMAITSGVGLLLLLGFSMTSVAYSMPFIVFCKLIIAMQLVYFQYYCSRKACYPFLFLLLTAPHAPISIVTMFWF